MVLFFLINMVKEADKEVLAFLLVMASPTVYEYVMPHRETSVPSQAEATHMAILQVKGDLQNHVGMDTKRGDKF